MVDDLPAELLAALDLDGIRASAFGGRTPVWHIEHRSGEFVVRRVDPPAPAPGDATALDDVTWVHGYLEKLAGTGFPAPAPVGLFGGQSVTKAGGALWEALTYVPGRVVGWDVRPAMFELGRFLAQFHDASVGIDAGGPRPRCLTVASLVEADLWVDLPLIRSDRHAVLASVDRLRGEIAQIGHESATTSVIHGDLTSHNMLVGRRPLVPCGAIDFTNAYVETTIADVGFALWRSGRPSQDSDEFDPERIARYVAGYHSRRPLRPTDAASVIALLRARGLQIVAKRVLAHRAIEEGVARKLAWLSAHDRQLVSRIERSIDVP